MVSIPLCPCFANVQGVPSSFPGTTRVRPRLPSGKAFPLCAVILGKGAAYGQADEATITRARGWAVLRALGLIAIGQGGRLGLPGGKPTWEPAGYATLERVLAAN